MKLKWILGPKPENMPSNWQSKITELFKQETGETYTETTFRMLGIPEWYGNKLLIDASLYPSPDSLMGVMWSKPLFENRIRVVALVINKKVQNNMEKINEFNWQYFVVQKNGKKNPINCFESMKVRMFM